jgi:hypothetical protein
LRTGRKGFVSANRYFHVAVFGAVGSETLLAIAGALWLQIRPYFGNVKGS